MYVNMINTNIMECTEMNEVDVIMLNHEQQLLAIMVTDDELVECLIFRQLDDDYLRK